MAEYWKSTPKYWCKSCQVYVRDTGLERKNHEASGKHQNNIQRGLRELHKEKSREDRDRQRAKDEVARLNGLVGGDGKVSKSSTTASNSNILGVKAVVASTRPSILGAAAQRKAHAEQLAALGVDLPEEMKRDVFGVGGWQTISEEVVDQSQDSGRSLADIVKDEHEGKEDVKNSGAWSRGVHKRKVEEEQEAEASAARRKVWGSTLKTYPGQSNGDGGEKDLEALLNGVIKKKPDLVTRPENSESIKREDSNEESDKLAALPELDVPETMLAKREDGDADAGAPVVFKKRKAKR